MKKLKHGLSGEFGHLAVELVFQASIGVHETDFLAVLRLVEGLKSVKSKLVADGFVAPESGCGTIPKEAEADEHAGIVIQIKCRRGNLDGDRGDDGFGVCGEKAPRGLEERERRPASEAEDVLQKGVGPEAEAF